MFALVAGSIAVLSAGAATPPPIRLELIEAEPGIELRVVGQSGSPYSARYALEVTSDAAAGRNRSVQRGNAKLRSGAAVTLVTLKLGNLRNGEWSAKLTVEPESGPAYEEVRGSVGR
jgi:hypothetical protein